MANFDYLISQAFDNGVYGDCRGPKREYSTFLGMTIESFDITTQWAGGCTLDATLYEDPCGDVGRPPAIFRGRDYVIKDRQTGADTEQVIPALFDERDMIGSPYRFAMGNFEFCGLLQSIRKSNGQDGKEEWKVQLKSPEDLVSNIHLVIGGYYNDFTMGNVFNIGKEIEEQKAFWFQEHQRASATLQRAYEEHIAINISPSEIQRWGMPHILQRVSNMSNFRTMRGHVQDLRIYLDNISPTTYGSLLYTEIMWAFNKIQSEQFNLWFNHKGHNGVTPHPDILVEDAAFNWRGAYYVDLSELPGGRNSIIPFDKLPQGFTIDQESITLEEFVKQVCGDDGFRLDYIWELRPSELRRLQNSHDKLQSIVTAKEEALQSNRRDPFPDISQYDLEQGLEEIGKQYRDAANLGALAVVPIIKLKICPQSNMVEGDVRQIVRTVEGLKQLGIGVSDHSTGLEKADDMPSIILNGGKKEIIVTAGNNLFWYDPIRTGDPYNWDNRPQIPPHNDGKIHPPIPPTVNLDNPAALRPGEYPSVFRMYFGQDRYDCPQVMFTEKIRLPYDFSRADQIVDGSTEQSSVHSVMKEYHVNSIFFDTYDLKASLRFFANNANTDWSREQWENQDTEGHTNYLRPDIEYRVPDYIKVSENEIRASIDYDLFWWSVCMQNGDLYQLFVEVLDPSVAEHVMFHDPGISRQVSNVLSSEQESDMREWMYTILQDKIADDKLSNVGRLRCHPGLWNMVLEDFKRIHDWVKTRYDEYYGKSYVTPFYFRDVTSMRDREGNWIQSFTPQTTGFREYGGQHFFGLVPQNTLMDGVRGLEVFTEADGKTHSFLRFFDPVRKMMLLPPRDKDGNIIPHGWGNGLAPKTGALTEGEMDILDPGRDKPVEVWINTINLDDLNIENMVRTQNFLHYKVQSVNHIKNGNLVHITLDTPVMEYQSDEEPNSIQGAINQEQMASWIQNTRNRLARDARIAARFETMLNERNVSQEPGNPTFAELLYDTFMQTRTNIGAGYSIASISPKAKFPIDGCYGVKCYYINYGPWILRNGDNPGRYEQDDNLTPWQFGSQFMDPEEAHSRMNATGLLSVATEMQTHKYAHILEKGTLIVAGYPAIGIGNEIANLIRRPTPKQLVQYQSSSFGSIYGTGMTFGHQFTGSSIDEEPYTGKYGPNVTRIVVNSDNQGGVMTTYDMSKNTVKDGMLAKHFIDRIESSSKFIRTRSEEVGAEIQRILDNAINAHRIYVKRNQDDYDAGRRTNTKSPHNVIIGQNIGGPMPSINDSGQIEQHPVVRSKVLSGVGATDVTHMMKVVEEFLNKGWMSWDGLFAAYATTDVKEGMLLEIELRRRIAESQGGNLTAEQENLLRRVVASQGTMYIPAVQKPKANHMGTCSTSDGPRFSTREDLRRHNEWKRSSVSGEPIPDEIKELMTPGVAINGKALNPLINPAHVDSNELMVINDKKRGRASNLGHGVSSVASGIVQKDRVGMMNNLKEGDSPYHPHYRAMGLNMPVMITGWGYDTNGQPVPRDASSVDFFSQNFASRKDLHVTAPLDLRYDRDRVVWTVPTPRMYFVVMLEDMQERDVYAENRQERSLFDYGYARGEEAARSDKATGTNESYVREMNNLEGQHETIISGFIEGYEHTVFNIPRRRRVDRPDRIISGEARILNAKSGLDGYINVETLSGILLKQGDRCFAWQDGAEDRYYAIPAGIAMDTGMVISRIERTGKIDPETNELMGGGLIQRSGGGSPVRAYCGMVIEDDLAIPEGAIVEFINVNGRNMIVNRLCSRA